MMATTDFFPKGIYRDRLITAQGRVIDRGWCSNLIVNRGRLLIAGFMRGDGPVGIQRLLIGRGEADWDDDPPGPPLPTTTQLVDPAPFERVVAPAQIQYLDTTGTPTAGPTNRLQLTVTLGPDEPPDLDPYPLREFGLFGSFGGEGFMINYVRHPVIHKPADATLERTIQLVF